MEHATISSSPGCIKIIISVKKMNENNLSNIRHQANTHFRNEIRAYLKDTVNELEVNSKNRRTVESCVEPLTGTNLVKDENLHLLAYSCNIVNEYKFLDIDQIST
jgi:hypothetical protein